MQPEVFAFSTSLTRLTAVLSHRSAEVALARANDKVGDRYGGTHLGRSLAGLLAPPHGNTLRGAVVIMPPTAGTPTLPRCSSARWPGCGGAPNCWCGSIRAPLTRGFRPLAGSMAAALPYCDVFLPAHSLTALRQVFTTLTEYETRCGSR